LIVLDANRVATRDLTIGVVGLGYVGLPTALGFYDAGFRVRGLDVSRRIIDAILSGKNPGDDSSLDGKIPKKSERWSVSTEPSETVAACDVILVTVPTPVSADHKPDLSFVKAAGEAIFDNLGDGVKKTVVVLESTVYPGVTREIWSPLLVERNLVEGRDVELAYCPERFVPGDPDHGVRQVARVVGTSSKDAGEFLVALYNTLTAGGVTHVGAIEVAEAAKVVENVQRDLNIALVNELALILPELGLDVEDVLNAAATKWNFHRYTPGLGVGGHCIPVDPYYLIERAAAAGAPTDLISAARAVNASMPTHVAKRVLQLLTDAQLDPSTATVLLLGWAYKPGISDARETPAKPLAEALAAAGAKVLVWDPYIQPERRPAGPMTFIDDPFESAPDAVVLCTAHPEVLDLDWATLRDSSPTGILYDGRRILNATLIRQAGWILTSIGTN
jgi:nucleotide sugar dehydrogenase